MVEVVVFCPEFGPAEVQPCPYPEEEAVPTVFGVICPVVVVVECLSYALCFLLYHVYRLL